MISMLTGCQESNMPIKHKAARDSYCPWSNVGNLSVTFFAAQLVRRLACFKYQANAIRIHFLGEDILGHKNKMRLNAIARTQAHQA